MKTSLRKLVWLGVLVVSTAAIAVASDDSQVIVGGAKNGPPPDWWLPTFDTAEDIVDRWVENGRQFINRNGQTCTYRIATFVGRVVPNIGFPPCVYASTVVELFTHPSFTSYRLRITEPTICDSGVKQYSGYLDITTGKHLFFWFFESRRSPETADFIYWTNGECNPPWPWKLETF